MGHPNETLLRNAYDAFTKGDLATASSIFADNMRWHVQGQSPLAGVYVGKQEILEFFERISERSGGTFRLDIHDVLANDEHVIVLVRERAEREGLVLAATAAHVWHVSNGVATEFWALPGDLAAADAFWS